MKKQKPIRKEQSLEELKEYFSDWKFDDIRDGINKVMREHPEVRDSFVIEAAADEMLNSAYTGVFLSTDDALRLVEYKELIPTKDLVKMLTDVGINDDNIMDLIFNASWGDEDYSRCTKSQHAIKTANWLQRYADILTRNPNVILLMLPEYSYHSNSAYLLLAFLDGELSQMEQTLLRQMKTCADRFDVKTEYEVTKVSFYIDNIWEKPNL